MNQLESLVQFGLSPKQAEVYLTLLQLGTAPVGEIAAKAAIKRPTAYVVLGELEERGLAKRLVKHRPVSFEAAHPEKLFQDLKFREEQLSQALPSLRALYNANPSKPSVTLREGEEGVKQTYRDIFLYIREHKKTELLIFGSLGDTLQYFNRETLNLFYSLVGEAKCPVRELGNDDHETRKYYRASEKLNPLHEIRLLRGEERFVHADNMIWGNRLSIFSVQEELFVTTIESTPVVNAYRQLFEMAWRSGKRI